MLVIRRRPGESLWIGSDIEIEILDCTHSQVKLGIRAPKEIPVLRHEIRVTGEQNRIAACEIPAEAITRLRAILPRDRHD
jgi:carbon storage regulator